jgi:hypothetical protein
MSSITSSGLSRIGPGSTNRAGGGSGHQSYPNPFFDPSSAYLPPSYKEMFRWASYLYHTHSEIAPIINKKCSYPITKLVYESQNKVAAAAWEELLERHLKLQTMEFLFLLDHEVYVNAFASIYYPFERYLECPSCKSNEPARSMDWRYKEQQFEARCNKCKRDRIMTPTDRPVKNRSKVRLIRWYPKYIDIDYNPFSDRSVYIYRIPKHIRSRVADSRNGRNKDIVADTPLSILRAIKEKANLRLHSDNIFHFKNTTVSQEDGAFGMPPLLPVFKDAWLHQTYRKAQEAVALDHVLPLTILSPAATSGGVSPHGSIDLASWAGNMQNIVRKWRRDPNGIFVVPFPAQVENIRGDAQALAVHNDMTQLRQTIAGGLDVPADFLFGGLNYSGSSISLRILENLFLGRKEMLDEFVTEFIIPKLRAFSDLPEVTIHHRDFKMADDAQQKQIALGLRQTNTISDRTTIEELGFDYETENERREDEEKDRLDMMERQQLRQAEIQGQVLVLNARYQAMAEAEQQRSAERESQSSQTDGYTGATPAQPGAQQVTGQVQDITATGNPGLLDMVADNFLKTRDPLSQQQEMSQIEQSNPALAKAIRQRMKAISRQVSGMQPLPEQKPPRRENSPV